MKPLRVYFDTSAIGGCLDAEFADESLRLVQAVQQGKIIMLLSEVVSAELRNAPVAVQQILLSVSPSRIEEVALTNEMIELAEAYLAAQILTEKSLNDAIHVAVATVARADAIVSWNFKHIVRLDKMKQYNQINLLNGYGILTIVSPKEVTFDDFNESPN
jgi:predicted nucleic acid-binding protein